MRRFYLQNVESIHEDTKKETCPNGQVPLLNMSELTYSSSTAACAAARRAMGTRKGEQEA